MTRDERSVMELDLIYQPSRPLTLADKTPTVPARATWVSHFGLQVELLPANSPHVLQLRLSADPHEPPAPRAQGQPGEMARSAAAQLALVREWGAILARSQILITVQDATVLAAMIMPDEAQLQGDDFMSGLITVADNIISQAIQTVFRCDIALLNIRGA